MNVKTFLFSSEAWRLLLLLLDRKQFLVYNEVTYRTMKLFLIMLKGNYFNKIFHKTQDAYTQTIERCLWRCI